MTTQWLAEDYRDEATANATVRSDQTTATAQLVEWEEEDVSDQENNP